MKIFNQGSLNILGKVLDYQTPLKDKQDDKAVKIDIVSYNSLTIKILKQFTFWN